MLSPFLRHFRRGGTTRLFALLCLLVLSSLGFGQDTLTPTWMRSSPFGAAKFSPDGQYVVTIDGSDSSTYRFWRVADGSLVASFATPSTATVAFSADSNSVLVASGNYVNRYSFPTLAYQGPLITDTNGIYDFSVAANGKYIAYRSGSGKAKIFSLESNSVLKIFSPPASASYFPIFTPDSTKLVCDGPTVFDLNGTKLAGKSSYGYPVAISPASDTVYQGNSSKMTAFKLSDLSTRWATALYGSDGWQYGIGVSADGKAVCMEIWSTGGLAGLASYNTATGAKLANTVSPAGAYYAYIALSPVDAKAWVGYRTNAPEQDSFVIANLNTSSGAGTLLSQGALAYNSDTPNLSFSLTSSLGFPLLLTQGGYTEKVSLYGQNDGTFRGSLNSSLRFPATQTRILALSPDGNYTAYVGTGTIGNNSRHGLIVTRNDTGANVTYVPDSNNDNDIQGVVWISSSRLVMKRYKPSNTLNIYDFNGSALTLVKSVACSSGYDLAVSSDGKRAITGEYGNLLFIDLDSGTSTGFTVSQESNVHSLRFADGYRFSLSYIRPSGVGYEWAVDLYDGASGTPTLVRSFKQPVPDSSDEFNVGLVSPNGKWVALANRTSYDSRDSVVRSKLTLYRVSDGAAVRSYDSQFVELGYTNLEFSADSRRLAYTTQSGSLVSLEVPLTISAVSVNPASVIGGTSSTGTVTLDQATTTDTVVKLASDQAFAAVPTSVTVPAGQTSATFPITTSAVDASAFAGISATLLGETKTASLGVTTATALTLGLSPATVNGGATSTGTVTLNGPAGPSGVVVALSSNSAAVTVPASVTVAAGQTSATFTAGTTSSASTVTATVSASALSTLSAQATLTVNPSISAEVTLTPTSTKGGQGLLLTVKVSSPAPAEGSTFMLSSDNPALVPPAKITVKAGGTTATSAVRTKPVLASTVANFTATLDGGFTKTIPVTILPPVVTNLFVDAPTQVSGDDVTLLIVLDGGAASGFTAPITSNSALIKPPATVAFTAGSSMALLTLKTTAFAGTAGKKVTLKVGDKSISVTLLPSL